jgi:hypothetical protein
MVLAEGTTNLMQRLARLPKAQNVNTLRRRKPVPSALSHNHHLHIRWCCIDQLSAPRFRGTKTLTSGRRLAWIVSELLYATPDHAINETSTL